MLARAGALASLVIALPAAGQTSLSEVHTQAVRDAIEQPLPPVSDVLGRDLPRAERPMVVIADFNEGSDHCRLRGLGQAVGVVLRVESWGLSSQVSFSHPTYYWSDSSAVPGQRQQARSARAAARSGADRIVGGRITEVPAGFRLEYWIADSKSQQVLKSFARDSAVDRLAATLAAVSADLIAGLGAEIDAPERERLERVAGTNDALLRFAAARRNVCEGADNDAELSSAWNDYPGFPALATLYTQQIAWNYSRELTRAHIEQVLRSAGAHPLVRLAAAYVAMYRSPFSRDDAALAALKAIAARYAHEPAALYAFADALAAEELIYDTSSGRTRYRGGPLPHPPMHAAGVAVALRLVEVWPESYRAWWCVAYTLTRYSNSIRGGDYWQNIPESARRRLPRIGAEIDYALARAIESHPGVGRLYVLQMDNDTNMPDRDVMATFWRAVAMVPDDAQVYRAAFNYSQDDWGGSTGQRFAVYRAAVGNNPGARWPDPLYREYAPWWESYPVTYARWALAALAIGLLWGWVRSRLPVPADHKLPLPALFCADGVLVVDEGPWLRATGCAFTKGGRMVMTAREQGLDPRRGWFMDADGMFTEFRFLGTRREWARPLTFLWPWVLAEYELEGTRALRAGELLHDLRELRNADAPQVSSLRAFLKKQDPVATLTPQTLAVWFYGE